MRAALVLVACLPACAWGDGEPFGAVTTTLDARWTERDDRANGDWQRLASDFEVQVTAATMELGGLSLIDVGGAEPPAVLTLPVGERDLVPGGASTLDCDGPCDLPLAEVGQVELEVDRVELVGLVRDTREPPRLDGEVAWTLSHARAGAPAVLGAVELPVDRGHDPAIALAVGFAPSTELLDGIRFAEAAAAPTEPWEADSDPVSLTALDEAFVELTLSTDVSR